MDSSLGGNQHLDFGAAQTAWKYMVETICSTLLAERESDYRKSSLFKVYHLIDKIGTMRYPMVEFNVPLKACPSAISVGFAKVSLGCINLSTDFSGWTAHDSY